MILECTKCNARFLVADSMVPVEGRMVRCGKCSHQWFVNNPAGAPATTDDAAAPSFEAALATATGQAELSGNVPALSKRRISPRPFKLAVPMLALGWLCLAFVTYFPKWMTVPGLSSLYAAAGITSSEGLVFDNVHMDREEGKEGDERTRFIVSGSIVNHAAEPRMVPTVHVALKDETGKAIWGRDYTVNTKLEAGEVYPFRIDNIQTSFAEDVSSIVLDVGNTLQLMVR